MVFHFRANAGNAQVRGVSACQPCICYRLPVNERIYSASLREGWCQMPQAASAGRRTRHYRIPLATEKVLLFRARGLSPYLLANIPPSRRRALSLKHPTLTFCSFSIHRHILFPTTRLSRGFRFTTKANGIVAVGFLWFILLLQRFLPRRRGSLPLRVLRQGFPMPFA